MGTAPFFSNLKGPLPISDEDFDWVRRTIFDIAGIKLSPMKRELVQARLRSRLEALSLPAYAAYRRYLESRAPEDGEWQSFINALTTNKTEFYREPDHFTHLAERALSSLSLKRGDRVRVWCAACSTGEEAYTLGAVMNHALPSGIDFSILASDLDTGVLAKASRGVYPRSALAPLPEPLRHGSFAVGSGDIAGWVRVSKSLRAKVDFQQINLTCQSQSPCLARGEKFDIIFCRNVFIYFSRETIREIVVELEKVARSGTYLYIGHTETLNGLGTRWKSLGRSIYTLP